MISMAVAAVGGRLQSDECIMMAGYQFSAGRAAWGHSPQDVDGRGFAEGRLEESRACNPTVTGLSLGRACRMMACVVPRTRVIPKILVVDDEPDAVELIKFNLKAAGYDVHTAADGEEALKKARALLPNLILLDLMLPEVDGLEVCKILRRDARVSGIPIISNT